MKFKQILSILIFLVSFFVAKAQESKRLQIADEFPVSLTSSNNYLNNTSTGVVYSKTFKNKGSAYIKIHITDFDLKVGDYLKVYNPENGKEFIYSERGKIVGTNQQMISDFWTGTIWSDFIIIELHAFSINSTNYGFNIDRVAYGHTPERINIAVESLDSNFYERSICTVDDKEAIICYDGTEMRRKAEAVCRLLIGGGGLCTGWLLGCDGSVMTNNHCIGDATEANNTEFLFNYRYQDCAETINATSDMQATSATFVLTDANLDFTLVTLPVNPTPIYGYLSLSSVAVTTGERIYIPQHPGGRRKEIAVNTDVNGDANGFAMVTDAGNGTPGNRVEYHADTEGGSSGSPVIRFNDNLVVAIHNTGGCPNGSNGRSDHIIAAIGANMPNCGVDDNNPPSPVVSANNSSIQPINEASDCNYQDITLNVRIAQPASQNADVSLIVAGGTATNNVDYQLLTNNVTFIAGDDTDKTATIRIFNDAFVEGTENIIISLALNANGGDAELGNLDTFNITILDNDYQPSIGNQVNFTFDDFETNLSNWTVTGLGTTNFAVGDQVAAASQYWNANGNTTNFAFVNDDECDCDMSQERMAFTTPFDFSNVASVSVNFDYSHVNTAGDLAYLQVSTDGGLNWVTIGDSLPQSTWTNYTVDLSAYAGQSNIMLSILYNDAVAWAYGLAIDNFSVDGLGDAIVQTTINSGVSNAIIPLSSTGTIHAYDAVSANIMSTISNNSGFDYGCIDVAVTREGNSAQAFTGYNAPILAMDKSYTTTVTTPNTLGDNTITFYFTEAEISGWETAVANAGGTATRNNLFIYRGTESVAATVGAFGDSVTLTGAFTGIEGTFYFAQDTSSLSVNKVTISMFSVFPNPVKNNLTIKMNENQLPEQYTIYSILGQVVREQQVQFTSDLTINTTTLASGLYFVKLNLESKSQVVRFIKE